MIDKSFASFPQNTTLHNFYKSTAQILALDQHLPLDTAAHLAMESIAMVDIVPCTGKHDWPTSDSEGYDKLRRLSDEHSVQYIKDLMNELPNLKCVILFGEAVYEFFTVTHAHEFDSSLVVQSQPMIHPSRLSSYGINMHHALSLYEGISKAFERMGVSTQQTSIDNVLMVFNPSLTTTIYEGYYHGKLILRGRRSDLLEIFRAAGVSVFGFPSEEQIRSGDNEVRGLELETLEAMHYDLPFGILQRRAYEAWKEINAGDAVIISEMVSRANERDADDVNTDINAADNLQRLLRDDPFATMRASGGLGDGLVSDLSAML